MKTKIAIFTGLLLLMVTYIGWIFYMSEPKYIDNAKTDKQNEIERYDVVSTQNSYGNVCIGLVMQIDSNYNKETRAIVKNFEYAYSNDKFTTIHLKSYIDTAKKDECFIADYRIIGKGTFYHKVNSFVGFNIIMITTVIIMIIAIILLATLIGLLRGFLGYDPFF